MEDILASIRRIISDDHEPAPAFRDPQPSPLRSVLDIAEKHVSSGFYPEPLAESEIAAAEDEPLVQSDPYEEERPVVSLVESSEPPASAAQSLGQPCERNPGEALMSRMTETSVADAFGRLGAARVASQPQTVEDLMKEMLRPMLKAWLDENLPDLVERLVKAEIERVTRG
ncbi:PopZ family protein [Microvirga solisilvae]|uniref:PopZ family protein n=1 Tax=Microvirga solisilvae TaxID=2919498 RepID=UPI0024343174|nr:DUF2497 domain-containing protein [Microvirga solisilvae]